MKIAVVTAHTPSYQPLADLTTPGKIAYAKKHGYTYMENPEVADDVRAYGKLEIILEAFYQGADIAFWTDTDAIITNYDIKVEDLLDIPAAITLTADILGINTGVFIAQKCPRMIEFLWASLYAKAWVGVQGFAEQTAMRELLQTPPYSEPGFCRILPQRAMNSYVPYGDGRPEGESCIWRQGDMILHMPGIFRLNDQSGVIDLIHGMHIFDQVIPMIIGR